MSIVVIIAVILLILIGLVGIVVPILPGMGLIYGGVLLYALYFGIDTVGQTTLIVLGIAALLSVVMEYVASAYGARSFGASKWGSVGAVLGGLIGFMILNIRGLILGVFVGAALAELTMTKKGVDGSLRAGYGAMLGFLGGTVLKFTLGIIMVAVFLVKVLF